MMVHEYNDPGCRRRSRLNLSGLLMRSAANGPGIRAVVWVQGCPIRCRGCFNQASWSFSPNMVLPADELAERILALGDIRGITFSGGEPFAQAGPLAWIAEQAMENGLDVITYSGYTWDQLVSRHEPTWDQLLMATDLLIAGPYRNEDACATPLMGSSNQQVIDLTGRIEPEPVSPHKREETIEFTIAPDGTITMTGFPRTTMVRKIAARCRGE